MAPTVYGRSLTSAKGFTSHWLRMISASIASSVGVSIGSWAHDKARALLNLGDLADIDTDRPTPPKAPVWTGCASCPRVGVGPS